MPHWFRLALGIGIVFVAQAMAYRDAIKNLYGVIADKSSLSSENWQLKHSPQLPVRPTTASPAIKQPRVVTVNGVCTEPSVRQPQACPGAPPPTSGDRVLATNARLTEADRNRFSNALAESEDSLNQGTSIVSKISNEGSSLDHAYRDGTIAKEAKAHQKVLSDLAAEAWKYQKAFPALRYKWNIFGEQTEYIFGDNPDNLGPNALINAAEGYRDYLGMWNVIDNKEPPPVLNLLTFAQNEFQARINTYIKWHQGCVARLAEMRNSIK